MTPNRPVASELGSLSSRELVSRLKDRAGRLVHCEADLARTELRASAGAELASAKALGAAGLLAWSGLTLLLVGAAMALALVIAAWAACLVTGAAALLSAAALAAVGWRRRCPVRRAG